VADADADAADFDADADAEGGIVASIGVEADAGLLAP
jgi:hypothetical protein